MNRRLPPFFTSRLVKRAAGRSPVLLVVAVAAAALALASAGPVAAQSVTMTGSMGSKALLVVGGGSPKAVAAGETWNGVKVVSVSGSDAVVEVGGKRQALRIGEPISIGGSSGGPTGTQIVLTAGSGGHFVTQGRINGQGTSFMVDTGATSVAMGQDEAKRLGIKWENGQRTMSSTANGLVPTFIISLTSIRIQDVEVYNVEAAVLPMPMQHILLGNSFLTRFQMKRENDTLTLTKRF